MWRTTVHQNGVALHYWGRKEKKTRAVKRKAEQNKRAFTGGKHGGVMETSSLFFLFMIFLFFFCFLVLVTHQREGQPVVFWGGFNAITHTYLTLPSSANLTCLPTTTSSNATTPNLSSCSLHPFHLHALLHPTLSTLRRMERDWRIYAWQQMERPGRKGFVMGWHLESFYFVLFSWDINGPWGGLQRGKRTSVWMHSHH